ncbi:MAG: radical SAM protein [Actinobacteria bacterium]|nr:radical SAM protein [Actinomycetota bacterium]
MRIPVRLLLDLLLKTPDVFGKLTRNEFSKWVTAQAEYRWGAGVATDLRQVDMKITNLCNLRCEMCAQWGDSGYNFDVPSEKLKKMVPLDVYLRLVDELASRKPAYYIWGGEPFLYPDLMPLVSHMKKRNALVSIISNGTLVEKHAEKLVRMGVDNFMFSLDGPADLHDRIRRVPGTFDKLSGTIAEINRWKRALNTPKPYIMFIVTLTPMNQDHLVSTMEIAERFNIDSLLLYYSWFTTEKLGRAHQDLMKREFGCDAVSWKGYVSDPSRFDVPKLVAEIQRMRSRSWPFSYIIVPELTDEQIPQYFSEPWNNFGNTRCISPWVTTEIQANGDVATCRDHPDYVVGNIMDEPILKIFNNAKYRKFRRHLQTKGLMPVCARCCGLMGF